ncbi:hypothetical protein RDI58_000344 [Solanum bulbocastanum]|uniref:Phenylalanyl tRNA synthetase beta chain core domain-containing protein n=2 Tax=Solanum TaxID=4107 RepID=A0AAN8U2Y5_SOLBU
MEATGTNFVSPGNSTGYYIEKSEEPAFLQGRQASVIYGGKRIGTFGIVHPKVLKEYDIPDVCSFLELDMQSFL